MRNSKLACMISGRRCSTAILFTPASPFRLSNQNFVRNFRVPHSYYTFRPSRHRQRKDNALYYVIFSTLISQGWRQRGSRMSPIEIIFK